MRKITLKLVLASVLSIFYLNSYAQNSVGIGTATPNTNAVLDLVSTNQGMLVPRMDTTTIKTLVFTAAENGMLLYADDINAFVYWDGDSLDWFLLNENVQQVNGVDNDWKLSVTGDTIYNDNAYVVVGGNETDVLSEIRMLVKNNGIRTAFAGSSTGDGVTAIGLEGFATGSNNNNIGVLGIAESITGTDTVVGIVGKADNIKNVGIGVRGSTNVIGGAGKKGFGGSFFAFDNLGGANITGIEGIAFSPGSPANEARGIYGSASGAIINWAGYFDQGNVYIKDTLVVTNTTSTPNMVLMDIDGSGKLVLQPAGGTDTSSIIADVDRDTKIQVEKTGDDDIIRFDIAGTERWIMEGNRLETKNNNGNIFIGAMTGNSVTGIQNVLLGDSIAINATTTQKSTLVGYRAGRSLTTGQTDLFLGRDAGYNTTTGSSNVMVGYAPGFLNVTGGNNTYIGYLAGRNATSSSNHFVGNWAGFENTLGTRNTYIGYHSGERGTTGNNNMFIGYNTGNTGTLHTTGSNNMFIGYSAGISGGAQLTNASAIGYNAKVGQNNSLVLGGTGGDAVNVGIGTATPETKLDVIGKTKTDSLMVGNGSGTLGNVLTDDGNGNAVWQAPSGGTDTSSIIADVDGDTYIDVENTSDNDSIQFYTMGTKYFDMVNGRLGVYNSGNSVFIGEGAGVVDDLINNNNNFIGYFAGNKNVSGTNNVATGYFAFNKNTSGSNNVAIGSSVLGANLIGSENVGVGIYALLSSTGNGNTSVGYRSLETTVGGGSNTALGNRTLYQNSSGSNNTAVGREALYSNVSGAGATAIGFRSMLYANSTTTAFNNFNVAVGYEALRGSFTAASNTGNANTSIGYQTLVSNTSGGSNTALGYHALSSNTSGFQNTGIGYKALDTNDDGTQNTANGYESLLGNTSGDFNTASGFGSGKTNTTGSNNTFIGYNADASANNFVNATAIGANAMVGQDSAIVLGNSANVGIGTSTPSEKLEVVTASNNYGLLHTDGTVEVGSWAGTTGGYYGTKSNHNLTLFTNNNAGAGRITITPAGGVGVGTNAPNAGFHIQQLGSGVVNGIRFTTSLGTSQEYFEYMDASDNLNINNGAIHYITLQNSTGFVGIGNGAPTTKLDIAGKTKTDSLMVTDGGGTIGNVLTDDGNGNAVWQVPSSGVDADWTVNADSVYNLTANVGLGTSAPTEVLHIFAQNLEPKVLLETSAGNFEIGYGYKTGLAQWYMGQETGSQQLRFVDQYMGNNNVGMFIEQGSGYVGMGGSNADTTLHVVGGFKYQDGNEGLNKVLTSDANGLASWVTPLSGADTDWQVAGDSVYNINAKIGIGIATPTAKTHIKIVSPADVALIVENGNATANNADVVRFAANSTLTNAFVLERDGQVGIGATVLNEKLTVDGVLSLREQAVALPSLTANYGKFYANGTDKKPHYVASDGTDYDLAGGGADIATTLSIGKNAGSDSLFNLGAITVNKNVNDSSAVMDLNSTSAGILITRMTNAQRNAITSPANALLIFQTDAGIEGVGFYYYDAGNGLWIKLGDENNLCKTGYVEGNNKYCIENTERAAGDFWVATEVCANIDARMCTFTEWYHACTNTLVVGGVGNSEWIEYGGLNSAHVVGNTTCKSISTDSKANSHTYRCCYSK